jgi:hypothetical protein
LFLSFFFFSIFFLFFLLSLPPFTNFHVIYLQKFMLHHLWIGMFHVGRYIASFRCEIIRWIDKGV